MATISDDGRFVLNGCTIERSGEVWSGPVGGRYMLCKLELESWPPSKKDLAAVRSAFVQRMESFDKKPEEKK